MNTRNQTFDLLKGVAILLMIQVHILELFASPAIYNSSKGALLLFFGGPPVAPVFMIIMGYFIAASGKTTLQLISRGVQLFCIGMLLNVVLNLNLIIAVEKGLIQTDLFPFLFGVDILQFAGLSIILLALFRNSLKRNLIFPWIGICAFAILGQFLPRFIPENNALQYISALFYGSAGWSYFPLAPWISYPLTGMIFFQLDQKNAFAAFETKKNKILSAILFSVFLVLTIRYSISVSSDLDAYYHHGFIFVCWVLCFYTFYRFFMNDINKLIGETKFFKYLKWLGENVTIVYIIQWIITGNLGTAIYKTITSPVTLFYYFLGILSVSSLLTLLIIAIKKRITSS